MTRGTTVVIVAGLLAGGTVVAALAVGKDHLQEAWYLYRLESGDAAVRAGARDGLVGLRSPRGVVALLERRLEPTVDEPAGGGPSGRSTDPDRDAAGRILAVLEESRSSRLAGLLELQEPRVYLAAMVLQQEVSSSPDSRVSLLVGALRSRTEGIRRLAAEMLARVGPAALRARGELEQAAAQDPSEGVRFWAGIALGHLEP